MDSSISSIDENCCDDHTPTSKVLEIAYEEVLRNSDLVIRDEGARRLRLRILLLENENDDLHDQLALGDDRIDVLEQECNNLRGALSQAQDEASRLESELKTQARELSNLKAELNSMNGVSTDSTRLLTEKLSLSRELALLKPEIEHLRSQVLHQQTVIAEKLALQRQLSTLEVELEAEKRASRRALESNVRNQKETSLQHLVEKLERDLAKEKQEREKARQEAEVELQTLAEEMQMELAREKREKNKARKDFEYELQGETEDLQKTLAREKRDLEKALKEAERELKASEARRTILEGKVDQMKTKLTASKDSLKECQEELSQARGALSRVGGSESLRDAPVKNSLKRSAHEMNHDVAIGTPDGRGVRGKRYGTKRGITDQMTLGEKSTFSITPYLNRTANIALDTPATSGELKVITDSPPQHNRSELLGSSSTKDLPSASGGIAAVESRAGKKTALKPSTTREVLADVQTARINRKTKAPPTNLEKVDEEEIDENIFPERQPNSAIEQAIEDPMDLMRNMSELRTKSGKVDEPQPKKKKRKLLGVGKTLFDEEDGEAAKRPAKIALGPARLLGKGSVGGGLKIAGNIGSGTFSPLKKDRRGVGSSFLS